MITKEILLQQKPRVVPVHSDELGMDGFVKVMTGPERELFEKRCINEETQDTNVRAAIILYSLCDEQGVRIFKDSELPLVNNLPYTAIEELAIEALKVNKIGGDSVIEEEAKNSNATPDAS